MRTFSLAPALAAGLLAAAPARAALPEIREFTLDNGMKVVLAPSRRVPALTYFTFFRVGSRNERPGLTGVSHFMEHMMFLGAKKYGPGEFDRVMEQAGGANNAFTAQDMTAYNDDVPSPFLEKLVDMEVDRMKDVTLDAKLFDSERHVVMEENRLRDQDDPDGLMEVALYAAAFKAAPYRWPVGGWMGDLEAVTRDQAYDYIKTYYAPNNATLVIAGDFDPQAAEKLLRARYRECTGRVQPPAPVTFEPPQLGPVRVELRKAVEAPALLRGYKVPGIADADTPALDLLAEVLGGGENSVLKNALVRGAALATDAAAGSPGLRDPALFELQLHLRPGGDPAKARAALEETLAKFLAAGATDAQVKAAKSRLAIQRLRRMETNHGLAQALGRAEIYRGDWRAAFNDQAQLDAVTPADLLRVARKHLVDSQMTEVTLLPEAKTDAPAPAAAAK